MTGLTEDQTKAILEKHNQLNAANMKKLVWNEKLASSAQEKMFREQMLLSRGPGCCQILQIQPCKWRTLRRLFNIGLTLLSYHIRQALPLTTAKQTCLQCL